MVIRKEEEKKQASTSTAPKAKSMRTRRPSLSSKEKKELADLLVELEKLQARRDALNEQMGAMQDYQAMAAAEQERDAIQEQIDEKEMRWMELEEKKEQLAL